MIDLAEYANLKICAAVSGGRDSMALLHYLYCHAEEYGITLSVLNCDHKIRGKASSDDSAFVRGWCRSHNIPLIFFEWDTPAAKSEANARLWRLKCYANAVLPQILSDGTKWEGADAVATAHHLNDNAETVLFNLARGSALSGLEGITESKFPAEGGKWLRLIHPLISCPREDIDAYVQKNNIPYVEDETNFTDDYTRNKIRLNVLPELEKAVPNAAKAIYRFSRLAAEDEKYFNEVIAKRGLIQKAMYGKRICFCEEKVIFRRAAVKVIKDFFNKKDYTSEHADTLYKLQFAENGKKFIFLGLTAYKEREGIVITDNCLLTEARDGRPFKIHSGGRLSLYEGQFILLCDDRQEFENLKSFGAYPEKVKILKFDFDKIPDTAVIRFMKEGDMFTKFGGGTKKLGDWFTDVKIPVRIRRQIPLIANGNEVLAVGGAEISDKIKITAATRNVVYLICADYRAQ